MGGGAARRAGARKKAWTTHLPEALRAELDLPEHHRTLGLATGTRGPSRKEIRKERRQQKKHRNLVQATRKFDSSSAEARASAPVTREESDCQAESKHIFSRSNMTKSADQANATRQRQTSKKRQHVPSNFELMLKERGLLDGSGGAARDQLDDHIEELERKLGVRGGTGRRGKQRLAKEFLQDGLDAFNAHSQAAPANEGSTTKTSSHEPYGSDLSHDEHEYEGDTLGALAALDSLEAGSEDGDAEGDEDEGDRADSEDDISIGSSADGDVEDDKDADQNGDDGDDDDDDHGDDDGCDASSDDSGNDSGRDGCLDIDSDVDNEVEESDGDDGDSICHGVSVPVAPEGRGAANEKGMNTDSASQMPSCTTRLFGAYVPPAARIKDETAIEAAQASNSRRLRGLLNKLTESTMQSVCADIARLFGSGHGSSQGMNTVFAHCILNSCLSETQVLASLIVLYATLVRALSIQLGLNILTTVVEATVKAFDRAHAAHGDAVRQGFVCCNAALLLGHLYNFGSLHATLIYELIRRLVLSFSESDLQVLIVVLRAVGAQLRMDDPAALKTIILDVHSKAAAGRGYTDESLAPTASAHGLPTAVLSARAKVFVSMLTDLKNNKQRAKELGSAEGATGRLRKWLKQLTASTSGRAIAAFKVSWDELVNAESCGRWWVVGGGW